MGIQDRVGWAQAALLFAACGAASSQLLNLGDWGLVLLPVPFGVLAAWLCVGRVRPGLALVVLDACAWQTAYRVAGRLGTESGAARKVLAMCLAGLIGGFGVALAAALTKRRAASAANLATAAAAGAICGLPFAAWLITGNEAPLPEWAEMMVSFGIWQGAVGLDLWRNFRVASVERASVASPAD